MDAKNSCVISWDGIEAISGRQHLAELEANWPTGVVYSSCQSAIEACMALFGSKYQEVTAILPVNAPYDAVMAFINANARTVLLDIKEEDLQLNTEQLKEALSTFKNPLVYLTQPGGLNVRRDIWESVLQVPTICDSRMMPVETQFKFTFNIYDLTALCGEGAVVFHKYEEQLQDLKQARILHGSSLSELACTKVSSRLPEMHKYPNCAGYYTELDGKHIGPFQNPYIPTPTCLLFVRDAKKAINRLTNLGIPATYGSVPVYKYSDVRKRWKSLPDYPVAEKLANKLIMVPNHPLVDRERIVRELCHVE